MADGQPIAVVESVFPTTHLTGIVEALTTYTSITRALGAVGVVDYTRASNRLPTVRASATQALHLNVSEGDPLLKSTSVNKDDAGKLVEYGRTWFAGDRVTLTLET